MNSLIRFGKSISVIAAVCVALVLILLLAWQLVGAESGYKFVIRNLLTPAFAEGELGREMAMELVSQLQQTIILCIAIMFVASAGWLAFANFIPVARPGEARNWAWVWFAIFVAGALASGAITAFTFFVKTDLLRPDQVVPSVIFSILAYSIVYFVFGSLLATPAHMRTAVPLATNLQRTG